MKITVTKIIRELEEKYGWYLLDVRTQLIIKDALKIVDEILRAEKNITILGKKK